MYIVRISDEDWPLPLGGSGVFRFPTPTQTRKNPDFSKHERFFEDNEITLRTLRLSRDAFLLHQDNPKWIDISSALSFFTEIIWYLPILVNEKLLTFSRLLRTWDHPRFVDIMLSIKMFTDREFLLKTLKQDYPEMFDIIQSESIRNFYENTLPI